jgi:hypothetical protein
VAACQQASRHIHAHSTKADHRQFHIILSVCFFVRPFLHPLLKKLPIHHSSRRIDILFLRRLITLFAVGRAVRFHYFNISIKYIL